MREKTSFVMSIAMSHRMPSHRAATLASVIVAAVRKEGEKASSCTTSGQAGKYGSLPRAKTFSPTMSQLRGSRA